MGLISRPDSPLQGFVQGASAAGLGAGLPILFGMLFLGWGADVWRALFIGATLALTVSLLGGLALAIWRVIQGLAYERFNEGP